MRDAAAEVGRRIRLRREELDLSQGELARRLGRTQTAVSYWEAGKRSPDLEDLLQLGVVLQTSVATLMPDVTARRRVGAVLRALDDQIDRKDLADELERFADAASSAIPPPAEISIPVAVGPRETAEAILDLANIDKPPTNVHRLAARMGIRVLERSFGDNAIDGLVVQLSDGPAIGLETNQWSQRKRFTLAHEIGHYVLRHHATFHVDYADLGGTAGDAPTYNWRHERAANEFAANLLMPATPVRSLHANGHNVAELARIFDVSKQAMGFRLAALALRTVPT